MKGMIMHTKVSHNAQPNYIINSLKMFLSKMHTSKMLNSTLKYIGAFRVN